MKKLIYIVLIFACSYSYAEEFVCRHQGPNGVEYIVEHLNGSICMKRVDAGGSEVKFNLFPAPSPEEQGGMLVFRDDENSFRLSLSHYPSSGDPASGEVVHTDETGDIIPENMSTFCD